MSDPTNRESSGMPGSGRCDRRRIIVCGGRDYGDKLTVEAALSTEPAVRGWEDDEIVIVHGDARGADRLAGAVAEGFEYAVEPHPADWDRYRGQKPNPAGFIRNEEMARAGADLCIAFPGGGGTADMVSRAKAHGIPVVEIDPRLPLSRPPSPGESDIHKGGLDA